MKGAVIGNGPSRENYEDRGYDLIFGCNIPNSEIAIDATVISDTEIVYVLKNSPSLIKIPIIVSDKALEKLKQYKLNTRYQISATFKSLQGFNSAHYAALRLIDLGCTEIDIWGCDSYFSVVGDSLTDIFVEPQPEDTKQKLIKNWRIVWDKIMKSHPDVMFTLIHD